MRILINIIKIFLAIIILYYLLYLFFVYKDVILCNAGRNELRGKIVYSLGGHSIKVIDLSSRKNTTIYSKYGLSEQIGFMDNPSFSPQGDAIVFSKSSNYLFDDKLYIMNSDGSNVKQFLDFNNLAAICPSWSPDGERIAFIVEATSYQGVYIIKLKDRTITKISDINPDKSQPTWSTDGKKIAFASRQEQRTYLKNNLYEVKYMGGVLIVDISSKDIIKYFDLGSEPSWSPEGALFAYGDKYGFHIIDLNEPLNSEYAFIPHAKIFFGIGKAFPIRWSPDGKYIVFCKEIWPGIAGIYVAPINNPNQQIRIGTDNQAIIGMSWAE